MKISATAPRLSHNLLKAKCNNFIKTHITECEQHGAEISESDLIERGMATLKHEAPNHQLIRALSTAVAHHMGKDLGVFFDLDKSSSYLLNINVKGSVYMLTTNRFMQLLTEMGIQKTDTE